MIINIVGDCDKRPVLYTVMKICQTLGDVLLVSSSTRLARLSDTREMYGHYQNTMIAVTNEGIDDFFENFQYDLDDFMFTIVDNIVIAEADLTIYVEGLAQSDNEVDMLEYVENYSTIKLYKGRMLTKQTLYNLEEFEALRDMCPIGQAVANEVAKVLSPLLDKDAKALAEIAMSHNPSPDTSGSKVKFKLPIKGVGK